MHTADMGCRRRHQLAKLGLRLRTELASQGMKCVRPLASQGMRCVRPHLDLHGWSRGSGRGALEFGAS